MIRDDAAFDDRVRTSFATSSSFGTRVDFYRRFHAGGPRWHDWLFERMRLRTSDRVLDMGCGTGDVWAQDGRARAGLPRLTLVDRSEEMLGACRERLGEAAEVVHADLANWDPPPRGFDRVLAAHVHFLVPDAAALARRVAAALASGGIAFFTSPAPDHLAELHAFLDATLGPSEQTRDLMRRLDPARLDAAARDVLPPLAREEFASPLRVTDAAPLVAFVRATFALQGGRLETESAVAAFTARLREHVEREVADHGAWVVTGHNLLMRTG